MREIKFRAWEPMNGGMVYFDGFIPFNKSQRYVMGALSVDNQEKTYYTAMNSDAIKIMQYTGLHDKNGKEIYEGDILSDGYHLNWVIVFDEASFKVIHTLKPATQRWVLDNGMASSREVIGNVYENLSMIDN